MADLCDYEVLVLRACAGEDPAGVQWGAAMSVALESLQSRRLIYRHSLTGNHFTTFEGRAYLSGLPK